MMTLEARTERSHVPAGHILDNPVWSTLTTSHTGFALRQGEAARFPPDIAPFVAVGAATPAALADARRLVPVGEVVFFLGVAPAFDDSWRVHAKSEVHQLVSPQQVDFTPFEHEAPGVLGAADREDMLKLAAEVYPYFFRTRTADLGTYMGVRRNGQLVAVGGERMRVPGFQEVSTVCVRPEHARSGFGGLITLALARRAAARGDRTFAHCVAGNAPVFGLGNKLGGTARAVLSMWRAERLR